MDILLPLLCHIRLYPLISLHGARGIDIDRGAIVSAMGGRRALFNAGGKVVDVAVVSVYTLVLEL